MFNGGLTLPRYIGSARKRSSETTAFPCSKKKVKDKVGKLRVVRKPQDPKQSYHIAFTAVKHCMSEGS